MWSIWLIHGSVQALIFKCKPIKLIVGQDRFDYNNNNNIIIVMIIADINRWFSLLIISLCASDYNSKYDSVVVVFLVKTSFKFQTV